MRRVQWTLSLFLAVGLLLPSPALAARFIDTSSFWGERYINDLSDKGVIGAEPDGKFSPDKPVTRAQLSTWLVKVCGMDNQTPPSSPSFPDVKPDDWFYKSVELARQNNLIA